MSFRPVESYVQSLERRTLLSAGLLDPSFGAGGRVTDTLILHATAAATDNFGRTVVVGATAGGGFAVARYKADGSRDTSFGRSGNGIVVTDFGGGSAQASAVAIDASGRIVVAGTTTPRNASRPEIVVARYLASGSLDTTFGIGGEAIVDVGLAQHATAVTIDPSGGVLVAGDTTALGASTTDFVVTRLNPTGLLDRTFGSGGEAITDVGGAGGNDVADAIAVGPNGRIVLVGESDDPLTGAASFALAGYSRGGQADLTFGFSGSETLQPLTGNTSTFTNLRSVAIDSSGRIVAAGEAGAQAVVARFNTNGAVDTGFGNNGLSFPLSTRTSSAQPITSLFSSVLIDGQGRIVAGGFTQVQNLPRDFVVTRLTNAGSLDARYGTSGVTTVDFAGGDDVLTALAPGLGLGGAVIAVGNTGSGTISPHLAMARLTGDNGSGGDTAPPTAALTSAPRLRTARRYYYLSITFADNAALDVSTIGAAHPVVTGPGGSRAASFLNIDRSNNGSPRTATFAVRGPGGRWGREDNGVYTVTLPAGQVADTSGNFAPAQTVGAFTVRITSVSASPAVQRAVARPVVAPQFAVENPRRRRHTVDLG